MRIAKSMQLALLAVLGGCTTHLESGKVSTSGITHGAVYNLPEVHYDIEVKRTLSQCPLPPDATNPNPTGGIIFDVSATATPVTVAGEEVAVDYTALADIMKISEFSIERWPSGVLKSVNVSVDDRTADVASEAFKAATSVAKIAIGLPPGQSMAANQPPRIRAYLTCTSKASAALDALPGLRAKARTADTDSKKAVKAHADYVADHPEEKPDAAVVTQISNLLRAKREKQEALEAANKAVADAVARITLVSRFTFVPRNGITEWMDVLASATAGGTKPQDVIELRTLETDANRQERWLAHVLGPDLELNERQSANADWVGGSTPDERSEAVGLAEAYWTEVNRSRHDDFKNNVYGVVNTAAVRIVSGPRDRSSLPDSISAAQACGKNGRRCGVLYRTKAPATLRICRFEGGALPVAVDCLTMPATDPRVIASDERALPQIGALASLGFSNGPFSNNILAAEFAEDGGLIKFSYKKPRAEAVAIGQTVNGGLDALSTIIAYERGKELRDLGYEKQLNDARAALITSGAPLQQPSEVTRIQNETKLIEEQRKKIEAEIELRKKQSELDALDPDAGNSTGS